MKRLNILYIHSHDTGRYVQPYGYAVETPNLQRLAGQGVVFRQAFCAGPTCSPSRAGLLTGQCPHSAGMIGLAHRGFRLNDYSRHIVHTLRRAGYASTLVGMQHVDNDPGEAIGYDQILPADKNIAESVTAAAVRFLEQPPAGPFFLSVGYLETHRKFPQPGPDDDPRYTRPPAVIPDTPRTRRDMAAFKTSARTLDDNMGRVFDALDRSNLAGDTLVICTTDHGIAFPFMKCNLTDHGTGVMLILRGPDGFSGGKVCDAMVSHIDIFPTICELLDIAPPDWLEGRSMLPLLRGQVEEINEEIFSEVTYHAAYEPMRAVRTKRWKYIRRYVGRETPVISNNDDSPSKDVLLEHGWRDRPVKPEALYDLVFDPNEVRNLAGDPAFDSVRDEMRRRLDDWMRRTDDPLLKGPVPAPPGAMISDPAGLSPGDLLSDTSTR